MYRGGVEIKDCASRRAQTVALSEAMDVFVDLVKRGHRTWV